MFLSVSVSETLFYLVCDFTSFIQIYSFIILPTVVSTMTEPKSFTTDELKNKINQTIRLANEIKSSSLAKNARIDQLVKLQSDKVLKLLTQLNNANSCARVFNFERPSLMDSERMNWIAEINDALVDKTIHYLESVKNVTEGKADLIEVKLDTSKTNTTKIKINDFNGTSSGVKRKLGNIDASARSRKATFLTQANVRRPQTVYNLKVDNNYSTPFIPKLSNKPNALVPLEESVRPIAMQDDSIESDTSFTLPTHFYPHPYQAEIESFEVPLPFLELSPDEPVKPGGPETKPLHYIAKREQLTELVDKLKLAKEVAIDLEHHSFRSYQGITCLLQLSTDHEDYIVDVFPLWSEMQMLNEITTDPRILKVFHGGDYDIIWLQRDLGLYVVNMFDTGLAARQLGYPRLSLSYLISRYCDIDLDKRFQLADWRLRPLPEEMLLYARADTHYLLYIYRMIKRDLLKASDASANLLRVVCHKSNQLCLKRYEKRLLLANDHIPLTWKNNLRFDARQLAALKSLNQWRDLVARNLDESVGYVLPSTLMLKIAEVLPREQQGILACCTPIPPLVRQYINEIHKLVLEARSKTVVETGTSVRSERVKRPQASIDLSHDPLIDHHHAQAKAKASEDDAETRKAKKHTSYDHKVFVPALVWDNESCLFKANPIEPQHQIEPRPLKKDQAYTKMADMFVSNIARIFREQVKLKMINNNMDGLFADNVSPYERYVKAMEIKVNEEHDKEDGEIN